MKAVIFLQRPTYPIATNRMVTDQMMTEQMANNRSMCVSKLQLLASIIQEVSIQSYHYTMPILIPELRYLRMQPKEKPANKQSKMMFSSLNIYQTMA